MRQCNLFTRPPILFIYDNAGLKPSYVSSENLNYAEKDRNTNANTMTAAGGIWICWRYVIHL